jgi:hypothetical protein
MTFSPALPSSGKYMDAYGEAISRTTYAAALAACTISVSVTSTNGSPTLTGFSDITQIAAGAVIEASFLAAPTTISSCAGTTCTMAANANASTTANATIFPYGDGCGFGTACSSIGSNFNLPDCRGNTLVGRNNMGGTASPRLTSTYAGVSPNALGAQMGSQSATLGTGNIPQFQFTPAGTISNSISNGYGGFTGDASWDNQDTSAGNPNYMATAAGASDTGAFTVTSTFAGNQVSIGSASPTPFATVPPALGLNCMIRVLAKLDLKSLPSLAANDNVAIVERRRAA